MLKEQLSQLASTRHTLSRASKQNVSFVIDEISTYSLLKNIPLDSPYFAERTLSFERHSLSPKEESKFNKKFSLFVKSLLKHMNEEYADSILEYIVRVYCADTYNRDEVLYLLIPFQKYHEQIKTLNGKQGLLEGLSEEYSTKKLALNFAKSQKLMLFLVEYSMKYDYCSEFIDSMLREIAHCLRGSKIDWLAEMYQVLENMISLNHADKAKLVYESMKAYLDSQEFTDLFSSVALAAAEIPEASFANYAGDIKYLGSEKETLKYLNYLENINTVPNELTDLEYEFLRHIYKIQDAPLPAIDSILLLIPLFIEMENKMLFLKSISHRNDMLELVPSLSEKELLFILQETGLPWIEALNEKNHRFILLNIKREEIENAYEQVYRKCIEYTNFAYDLFEKLVHIIPVTSVGKRNFVAHAEFVGVSVHRYLAESGQICEANIEYVLSAAKYLYTQEEAQHIFELSLTCRAPSTALALGAFIKEYADENKIKEYFAWAHERNLLKYTESLAKEHIMLLETKYLKALLLQTECLEYYDRLSELQIDVIAKLYEEKAYDLLCQIGVQRNFANLLIETPHMFEFLSINCSKLQHFGVPIVNWLLRNFSDRKAIACAQLYPKALIQMKNSCCWEAAKVLMADLIASPADLQYYANYIVVNIEHFIGEDALFSSLMERGAMCSEEQILLLSKRGLAASKFLAAVVEQNPHNITIGVLSVVVQILIRGQEHAVEKLYATYRNVLGRHTMELLQMFPSASRALLHVDCRHTIKEICKYLAEIGGEINSSIMMVFLEILNTSSTICTASIRALAALAADKGLKEMLEANGVYFAIIAYYVRCNRPEYAEYADSMLLFILHEMHTVFAGIYPAFLKQCPSIFKSAFSGCLNRLEKLDENLLKFVSAYVSSSKAGTIHGAMDYSMRLLRARNSESIPLLGEFCKHDTRIIADINRCLLADIAGSEGVLFALTALKYLFKEVKAYSCNKEVTKEQILLLTQDSRKDISNLAKELYEVLLF
ncbi:hypothetical protein ENBRE01_1378 [Enteropsectra breve]|nr:hypothetical protein ENBRE01_1378 [Enteropsectra breve]